MFYGQECLIEHVKTLRLKYRDLHIDSPLHIDAGSNTTKERKRDFIQKGWVDISNEVLNLDGLLAFIGIQTLKKRSSPILPPYHSLRLIKFRHSQGKTQARITFSENFMTRSEYNFIGFDNFVEIFIFRRLDYIHERGGRYGINVYDSAGNLKFTDGLNLMEKIKTYPVKYQVKSGRLYFDDIYIGEDKLVLQSALVLSSQAGETFGRWLYHGGSFTAYLKEDGYVTFVYEDSFSIAGFRRNYPSYAKGGAYHDIVNITDHILVIDKPRY